MRVTVHAVGRMKAGPERDLVARYLDRFAKAGPAIGLELAGVTEIAEGRQADASSRLREEGKALLDAASGGWLVVLDERGKHIDTAMLAETFGRRRDDGEKNAILAIGGPDGHSDEVRERADLVLSFGRLTWPHQLVRIMAAEQLYRIATVLAGHPYHRG